MANAVVTLDADLFNLRGYVRLSWTNANKGAADWYAWRVYRRPVGGTWVLLKEYLVDQASYEYRDYTPASNVAHEWVVVRTYLVSSVPTEETRTANNSRIGTPYGDNYWLIHPTDESKTLLLHSVVSEDFSDQHDSAELLLIGRGRKVDQGSVWGLRGSLSCQLRDKPNGPTAREQLTTLRTARAALSYYWLRNPFGDVLRVSIGDVSATRLPGVGLQEFVDVNFDYAQVVV